MIEDERTALFMRSTTVQRDHAPAAPRPLQDPRA